MTQSTAMRPHFSGDTQEERERGQEASLNPLQEACSWERWWTRRWRAAFRAGFFLWLCVLSQITGVWILYMMNGYNAFPAAHKVLDLVQYLLSALGAYSSAEEEMPHSLWMDLWRIESICPLLATLFLGIAILAIGIHHCLKALFPGSLPTVPNSRRQSMSRQPSFTYSEWTDTKPEDLFDLDPVPETPIFESFMDIKAETDPGTLTVKPVGLQERRGSNVSLTLDMCTPGCTEPYGALLSPGEQSAREYLQKASNVLTATQLHSRALDDAALQAEFFETPMNFVDPKEYSYPGIVRKNRYKTILPNKHSRVCLKTIEEDDFLNTYINANYLKGYGGEERTYIATQGPTVNTVSDFWKMVWQEHSPIIVMITNVEEKNEKCTEYWPEDSVTYEGIEITVTQVIQANDYRLRIFSLKCNDEVRSLRHYWYTSWPDQKTPDKAPPLLELVEKVEKARQQAPPDSGPVIVHCRHKLRRGGVFEWEFVDGSNVHRHRSRGPCREEPAELCPSRHTCGALRVPLSWWAEAPFDLHLPHHQKAVLKLHNAGIGRTGCFIATTILCKQLMNEGMVDILKTTCQLRLDRGGMIQTPEQYQFVHHVLSLYERQLFCSAEE